MQGVRFYEEFTNTRKRVSEGNVFACFHENVIPGTDNVEGLGAVYFEPNSPVAGTSVSRAYLRARCKRIPESKARAIHPALFSRLDDDNA